MTCLPFRLMNSERSLLLVQINKGIIKFPKGKMYLANAPIWIKLAIFFWFLVNMMIDDIVFSYANIYLLKGIMQYKVLKINISLTN